MSKVEFKEFVSKNPYLINQVTSGKTSWQKLYEIFDLYGESKVIVDMNGNKVPLNEDDQIFNESLTPAF